MNETQDNLEKLITLYQDCKEEKKRHILYLKIIEESMSTVKQIANSIAKQSGVSNEDLIQVGSLGLIKAVALYKQNINTKFKTYSIYFIKGEIKHYLRDKAGIIKAPRELHEMITKVNNAIRILSEQGIEEPTSIDVSNLLHLPVKKVEEVMDLDKCKIALSLDQYFSNDNDDMSLMDKLPSGDYQEFIDYYEKKIMLKDVINKLPDDLKIVIMLNFYDDMSQREISEKLNISQMQVSRRIKKALNRMYEILDRSRVC